MYLSRLTYKGSLYIVRTMITSSKHRITPKLIGPSFIALQVRDLEVSKTFYVEQIGLTASPHNPPGAVVFNPNPVPFAIRRDTQLPPTRKSQSRQRQRWTQAADI